jgi:hypothetical protein
LLAQNIGIDGIDIADVAVVDTLPIVVLHRWAPMCLYQTSINAADSNCRDLQLPTGCQNTRVDLAVKNHCRNIQRLGICNAATVNERRVHAERGGELSGLWSAAMHQHDADSDLLQYPDLLHQGSRARNVRKYFSTGFQDEYLSFEKAYIRCGVFQSRNDNCMIVANIHAVPPII